MSTINVIIADEHPVFSQGFRSSLENAGFKVVAEVDTGKKLVSTLETNVVDLILLGLEIQNFTGEQALDIITVKYPNLKVLLVSMFFCEGYVSHYLKRGAHGYLPKTARPEKFLTAIDHILRNGVYLCEAASMALVKEFRTGNSKKDVMNLTVQEVSILRLICSEKKNKEIADILNIVVRTVDFHRKNIYEKTNTKSTAGLVKYAVRHGLISLGNPFLPPSDYSSNTLTT